MFAKPKAGIDLPTDIQSVTMLCTGVPTEISRAMRITHLLDPMPTEAHVHWSLWADTPMYVATNSGLWAIEEGRVRPVSRKDDE